MASIRLSLLLAVSFVTACSSAPLRNSPNWQSSLYSDHPLVGKIWSSANAEFVDVNQLLSVAEKSRYLLLGEKHDNPDHHNLQTLVIEHLAERQRIASIAFEMLDGGAQARLDSIGEQQFSSLEEMKDYLQWDETGWDWSLYGPLLQAGYNAQVSLTAANIDDDTMRQVYSSELPIAVRRAVNTEVMEQLNLDIDESHCGLLPASQFPAMVRVQQSRDNNMATALRRSGSNGVNILIAGNYHVREDLGVPNYLRMQEPTRSASDIVTLSFSEVDPASTNPADYLQQFSDTKAYDFIWFTPAVSDEDYCASLRQVP